MRSLLFFFAIAGVACAQNPPTVDWPGVGGEPGCSRYSPLDQINRDNVSKLEPAWTYHTGELEGRAGKVIECTPIIVDGVMYLTTGYLRSSLSTPRPAASSGNSTP